MDSVVDPKILRLYQDLKICPILDTDKAPDPGHFHGYIINFERKKYIKIMTHKVLN